jgi:hypothetical protein
VGAFDEGWNAHREGLGRETVRLLAERTGRDWALLGWDMREQLTRATGQETCEP